MTFMSIWLHQPDIEALNRLHRNTAVERLGIIITEVGDDFLRGTMPVDARTVQPLGLLHGGASVLLAETLGSVAALCCVDRSTSYCVGLDINANHVRSAKSGRVTGTARPFHVGRTSHVWDIHITDEAERLICVARLTILVVNKER
jgi:1,4-dihydroxy-2-naphthoyl-CoA hydrolase